MYRILLTGASGFLGRAVCQELEAHAAVETDLLAVDSTTCDLLDRAACRRMLADFRPHAVIHLAARVGGIGLNRQNPGTLFYQNMIMGAELIEACREIRIEHFILAGSVCSYPKHCGLPFREDDLWIGYPEETNAPYGVAKKALMVQLDAYRQEFQFNSTSLLIANLYGPGDCFDIEFGHVIPAMMCRFHEAKMANARSVTLWGDGSPTREFLYVDDAASAIRLALQAGGTELPVNIGTGIETSIADLAEVMRGVVGFTGDISWDTDRPNGQPRRQLNTSRAEAVFGFRSKVSLVDGLARTYRWFLAQQQQGAISVSPCRHQTTGDSAITVQSRLR